MSAKHTATIDSPPAPRWRLWVDSCGGFLLLAGNRWTLGGISDAAIADICVRADWPRLAGWIERAGSDYFWQGADSTQRRQLLTDGQAIPVTGSATVSLGQPSPLCDSAVLRLAAPHRFDEHVDGIVLVNETILVGPGSDCHVRCRESSDRAVLTRRDDRWLVKAGLGGDFQDLLPGKRTTLRSLAMTLEEA